jgi:hypothetical protein
MYTFWKNKTVLAVEGLQIWGAKHKRMRITGVVEM